jgi:cytochrome b561
MKNLEDASARYTPVAIALHWVVALVTFGMIGLGYTMVSIPTQTPLRGLLFNFHKSMGILLLGLFAWRLIWRLNHVMPKWAPEMPQWRQVLARTTHLAFYVLLMAQAIFGLAASAFGKFGVDFFGIQVLPGFDKPSLRAPLILTHHLVAAVILSLILLHISGAVWSCLKDKGGTFRRMWW